MEIGSRNCRQKVMTRCEYSLTHTQFLGGIDNQRVRLEHVIDLSKPASHISDIPSLSARRPSQLDTNWKPESQSTIPPPSSFLSL